MAARKLRIAQSGSYYRPGVEIFRTVAELRDAAHRIEPGQVVEVLGQESAGDGFGGQWIGLPEAEPGTYTHDGYTTVMPEGDVGTDAVGRVSGAFLVGPLANGDAPASWRSPNRGGVMVIKADTVWGLPPEVADYGVSVMVNYTNDTGSEVFSMRGWDGGDALYYHGDVEEPDATSGNENVANIFLTPATAPEPARFFLNNRQVDSGPRHYRVNMFL